MNLKNFKLNKEGSFSITRPHESNQILNIITEYCNKNMIITDATSCIGGDSIRFSKYFNSVNSVEIDEDNFNCLVENIKRFGCHNILPFLQDYLEIYDKLKQDIIYIDPPWGGMDYKSKKEVFLKMGNIDLSLLIKKICEKCIVQFLFIKVPFNVSLENIRYDDIKTVYNRSNTGIFQILIIKCK